MTVVREATVVELEPARCAAVWADPERWKGFVDGFARVAERDPEWPREGSQVVWESTPGGRGTVNERVVEWRPPEAGAPEGRLVTDVRDASFSGRQTAAFSAPEDGDGTRVDLELDYELPAGGPLKRLTDLLFIRRAMAASLGRTLRRFGSEAAEEASL
jgi:uncharacterized membrane protein